MNNRTSGIAGIVFLITLLFPLQMNYTQSISILIAGYNGKACLSVVTGEQNVFIDSLTSDGNNSFNYSASLKKLNSGLYRFSFSNNQSVEFIYDNDSISFSTDVYNHGAGLKILHSENNKLLYAFLKINRQYKLESDRIGALHTNPKDSSLYEAALDKFAIIQNNYLNFIDSVVKINPGSFTGRYIKSSQLPIVDYNISPDKRTDYLKAHALDNVNFKDGELTNSDLFTNKAVEYLNYYRSPQVSKEQLQRIFIKAIDALLNKAKVNDLVYKQIIECLVNGFKKFGFEGDLEYIVNRYIIKNDICLDEKTEASIENIVNQSKILHINAEAPDIIMKDTSGSLVDMYKIKSDKILILFYASWCPHCKDIIPKLAGYLDSNSIKNVKVLAISLDANRKDWLNFIKSRKMNWVNLHADEGWDCKAARDYFIYATPTLFLIDMDKKIIGKPFTIGEIKKQINP